MESTNPIGPIEMDNLKNKEFKSEETYTLDQGKQGQVVINNEPHEVTLAQATKMVCNITNSDYAVFNSTEPYKVIEAGESTLKTELSIPPSVLFTVVKQ